MRIDELKIQTPHPKDTLGVPRRHMPQIDEDHYKELFKYLFGKGIKVKKVTVDARDLDSTQAEFSDKGIEKSMTNGKLNKPIIISSDNYVLDGHHRWLAAKNGRKHEMTAFQVSVPAKEGLSLLINFPKTTFKDIHETAFNEGYKLQLERDTDMMVLNITDTATGKRTEVRGKAGYETNGYDPEDKLHQLLDKVGRSANVSELMNGEVVTINPKHPNAEKAKAATDVAFNESLDNPYPFNLSGPNDAQEFVATANTPNGTLRMDFETSDYDNFDIDFAVGKSMGKTEAGDEFRVFATVVAMMKKWISTVGIQHVESFDFGANKDEHASDGRAKLYARFAKQLASKLGWRLEQSTTRDGGTAFFRLVNPKPVPREQEYWDALEESINENVLALQAELEQKYNLKSLFLSDMGKRNAIELHSIIVNKEEQGSGNGSKVMQEIIAYADANGKIVVLDPGLLDKKHGTTSQSRLRKFYKRFGFIDNKGRNKNYEFRNLMIRYPQSNESVNETAGVGRVVKGVNTTVDVGPNEIIKQVKKFGNDVDRDGKPKKNLK